MNYTLTNKSRTQTRPTDSTKIIIPSNRRSIGPLKPYAPRPDINFKIANNTNYDLFSFQYNIKSKPYIKNSLIIMLRGHIRDSFDTPELYNLMIKISKIYNIKIYIHTWNKKANTISWREYPENKDIVDVSLILNYFKDLSQYIVSLTIDDDETIVINGEKEGKLFSSGMKLIGWKYMWYGMKKVMDIIYDNEKDDKLILNTRFDLLTNSQKINEEILLDGWNKSIDQTNEKLIRNKLYKKYKLLGIDNQIIGDRHTMKKLIDHFNDLDKINALDKYKHIITHEIVVYYENNILFDV